MKKLLFSITGLIIISAAIWFFFLQKPVLFQCADKIGCISISPGKPVKIGIIQSLSGGTASFGTEQLRGVEMAVAARNSMICGHPLKLYVEDELCSFEGGTNAALKISSIPNMAAVIGTTCSGAAVAASPIISEAGLVMISGANIAPSLTAIKGIPGLNNYPGYYRTIYNGAVLGKAAAMFAIFELGITRAATIDDTSEYTRGLTYIFKQVFLEYQRDVVFSGSINKGDKDMVPILNAVKNSQAQFVFFPVYYPEGAILVRQSKDISRLEPVYFMSAGALMQENFIDYTGRYGKGVYFVTSVSPDTLENKKLVSEYEKRYGSSPVTETMSYAYDAANILLNAIEKAAEKTPDESLHIGQDALRKALDNTKNYKGVTGSISCDGFGDCGIVNINVLQLNNPGAGIKGLKSNVIKKYISGQ